MKSTRRRDSAVGDTVITGTRDRGKGKGLDRDWNGAQQVHELKGLRGDFSTFSDTLLQKWESSQGLQERLLKQSRGRQKLREPMPLPS